MNHGSFPRSQGIGLAVVSTEWLLLLLMLPAVLFITPATSPVLLIIPILWIIRRAATGYFVPATPLNGALALLLFMVLVSLSVTFDVAFSWPKVAGLIYGVALFYTTVSAIKKSPRRLWLAVLLFIGVGVGVATVGLLMAPLPAKIPLIKPIIALLSSGFGSWRSLGLVNPNEVAGVLLWVAPLMVSVAIVSLQTRLAIVQIGWNRLIRVVLILAAIAATLLFAGVLVLSQSRSGLLGFGVALLFMAVAVVVRRRKLLLAIMLLTIAVGATTLFFMGPVRLRLLVDGLVGVTGDNFGASGLTTRPDIWQRALFGIADFPYTGMGMGTFRRVMPVVYPIYNFGDKDIAHAHNHLLQTALDLGLPGLIAYLALWFGAGKMLWKSWSRASSLWLRALAIGLAGSLVAYFVYGVFDTVALGARPGFLFWVLFGLVASLYQVVGDGQLLRLSSQPNPQNKETLPVSAESGRNAD